jgi:hypothetical protein
LLDAMFRAAKDESPAAQEAVYRALIDAALLMPIPEEEQAGAEGWTMTTEPVKVKFISAPPEKDGTWRFLAFSSEGALTKWRPQGCRYIAMRGRDVFRMLMETEAAGLAIDVAGPWGGELPRTIVQLLAEGTIPIEAKEGSLRLERTAETKVEIGALDAPPPETLVRALREAAARVPVVTAISLAQMTSAGGEPHLTAGVGLGVDLAAEGVQMAMEALVSALNPLLPDHETVDLLVLDEDTRASFDSVGPPVYERSP